MKDKDTQMLEEAFDQMLEEKLLMENLVKTFGQQLAVNILKASRCLNDPSVKCPPFDLIMSSLRNWLVSNSEHPRAVEVQQILRSKDPKEIIQNLKQMQFGY